MKSIGLNVLYVSITIYLLLLINSCSPVRYVERGKYIVDDVEVNVDQNDISTSKLKSISQPVPLKKLFGVIAIRARIYNIVDTTKNTQRKEDKQIKIERKNERRDNRFERESNRILDKRNKYFNRKNRLDSIGDTTGYKKAYAKYLEYEKKYTYRSLHAQELKLANHKEDVFTLYEFIQRSGQEPQLYDTVLVNYTKRQFDIYLRNQGYFKSVITDTIKIKGKRKKRVKVIYNIEVGEPLTIGKVKYNLSDSAQIMQLLHQNTQLKLKEGERIDVDELEKFRTNLASYYRENGYYYFSKQLISYQIDTTGGKYDDATLFVNFNEKVDSNKVYKPWYIKDITFFSDYSPNQALQDSSYYKNLDTSLFKTDEGFDLKMLVKNSVVIKPKFIAKEIYLYPDSLYKLSSTKSTYSHLSKFKIYKLTNIEFSEADTNENFLNCDIKLTPDKNTDVTFEVEATHNALNIGGGANAIFSHRNLFHGGEVMDMSLELALQHQKINDSLINSGFFNTQEYNLDLKFTVPRLLMPFRLSDFIKRNNPRTIISTLFSYQNRPEYSRIQAVFKTDFYLKSSDFSNHLFTPLRFSYIEAELTPVFLEQIQGSRLMESYEDHFIIGSNYTYTFSNQGTKGNTVYLQSNVGLAGNLLYLAMKNSNIDTVGGVYYVPFFNAQYAQFVKTDVDFRYIIDKTDFQYVSRVFLGVGVPLGNSNLLPFGEKYFVGGSNSIRGWEARTLGPGSYQLSDSAKYVNQTGDIKIEMNFEYRFKIINFLEGAMFLDAGNIWAVNSYDTREGSVFYLDKFYKQIAVSTGVGARVNLGYFVFRTDVGLKLIDPSEDEGKRIIPANRAFTFKDLNFIIAIGYPF